MIFSEVRTEHINPLDPNCEYLGEEGERVEMLWDTNYWDGPTEGIAQFADVKCYFITDDTAPIFRKYWLLRLTPEQIVAAETKHQDFQELIGFHCDYGPGNHRATGPHAKIDLSFWTKYPISVHRDELNDCEVIGWFEL